MNYLCISVRWLDDRYHGQDADGMAEWPPSPLRLLQAMLAGLGRIGAINKMSDAMHWFEEHLAHPHIVAPRVQVGQRFTRFVPNNDSDKQFSRQNRLAAKEVSPTIFLDSALIYYLWPLLDPLTEEIHRHVSSLTYAARSICAFGWGIDMVVGDGAILTGEQVDALPGERWCPGEISPDNGLRVPVSGTLEELAARHSNFLSRLDGNKCTLQRPLSVFEKIDYRRATDSPNRPVAAFSLLTLDAGGFQPFNTTRKALTVAGMMRYVTKSAAEQSGKSEFGTFILGHGESPGSNEHTPVGNRRFAYLPLPSIEARGKGKAPVIGDIRRVMLTVLDEGCDKEIAWARRALSGQTLVQERDADDVEAKKKDVALLSLLPNTDTVVQSYLRPSATWATVTPVVLPGYDDPSHYRRRLKQGVAADEQLRLLVRLNERIEGLIRKAIVQAGFSQLLADNAEIEWRSVGYWRGADLADRYGVPEHLKRFSRCHVKIQWRDEHGKPVSIRGPICIGGGRFYGLGLFAAM